MIPPPTSHRPAAPEPPAAIVDDQPSRRELGPVTRGAGSGRRIWALAAALLLVLVGATVVLASRHTSTTSDSGSSSSGVAHTRTTVEAAVCAQPSDVTVWGAEPDAIAQIYYHCTGPTGGNVFLRFFDSPGAEQLYARRVAGITGQQTVLGDQWAIASTDTAALRAALNIGGELA
jgi:hypothetical protein